MQRQAIEQGRRKVESLLKTPLPGINHLDPEVDPSQFSYQVGFVQYFMFAYFQDAY